jgi:non-specific serine/threonine protein kinase
MAQDAASSSVESLPSRSRCWRFASAVFDERTLELSIGGEPVDIERKPSEVLLYLLLHAGEVVTKDELLEAVWPRRILTETALTKCIARLREALGDTDQTIIKTLYGMGYRLIAPVRVEASSAPPLPRFDFAPGDTPPSRPHWKLSRRLGGGSHGEAWLAQHDKTAEQRVFKFALDASALVSLKREITLFRLLNDTLEERARAVRLLDWNLEQPPCFIETEFIAGGSLADWIAAQNGFGTIPLMLRIDIAAQIADALAGAHSVGVLHKDLKPSNVFTDADETGRPRVKLGDFGSGGIIDPDRLDALHITRLGFTGTLHAGEVTGTLTYLAPEVLAGQPSTVQTDIYALGVILYQLVVGDLQRPLAPGWERDVDDELLREDIAAAADIDPARRLGDAGELARRLRTIEGRRNQRESERDALAAATCAREEAQQARQEAERLRARRTGMRIALAVLLLALAVGSILFIDARRARARAELEAAHAVAVSDFLNNDVLSLVSSGDVPVKDLTVKQLLDSAAQQVDKRFADQPDIAADIDHSIGMSYYRLNAAKEEQERFERGLAILERSGRGDTSMALTLAGNLIWLDSDNGLLDEHIARYEDVLRRSIEKLGALDPNVMDLRGQVAGAHAELGRWRQSTDEYRQLLDDTQRRTPDDTRAIALLHLAYGWNLVDLALFAQAETELRQAIAMLEAIGGPKNFDAAKAHWRLGQLWLESGRFVEAETELRLALSRLREWQHDDSNLVIGAQLDLATLQLYRQQPADAVAIAQQLIVRLRSREEGERNLSAPAIEVLALSLAASNRMPEAVDAMQKALDGSRTQLAAGHPDIRRLRMELSELLLRVDRAADARAMFETPPLRFDDLPVAHPLNAERLRVKALIDRTAGNVPAARAELTTAMDALVKTYGAQHWRARRASDQLAATR